MALVSVPEVELIVKLTPLLLVVLKWPAVPPVTLLLTIICVFAPTLVFATVAVPATRKTPPALAFAPLRKVKPLPSVLNTRFPPLV